VDRRERQAILSQGATRPETPRDREVRRVLETDLPGSPVVGRPLRRRLRNFRPDPHSYLSALGGPLPWMVRLREIDRAVGEHERRLAEAWEELRAAVGDRPEELARRWIEVARGWRFDETNALVERHNRNYPAEARLPMDPRTGDFVLVNGKPYRREPLDERWILSRFPAAAADDRAA
jgi:hypothetical protein